MLFFRWDFLLLSVLHKFNGRMDAPNSETVTFDSWTIHAGPVVFVLSKE
jgi:hypothetical protein